MRAPARPLRPRRRAQRTPKALPLDSMSSTLFSFDDATIFITLVILATLFVARMRSLTARGGGASERESGVAAGARDHGCSRRAKPRAAGARRAAAGDRGKRAPAAAAPGTRRAQRAPATLSFSLSRRR